MLTHVQMRLLRFIQAEIERAGVAPTVQEMCGAMGYTSKGSAARLLQELEARGAIRRLSRRSRAIEVLTVPAQVDRHAEAIECLRKLVALADDPESPAWDRAMAWARRLVRSSDPDA